MRIVPVLFDTLPAYAGGVGTEGSLLSLPMPEAPLFVEIMEGVRRLTSTPPYVVTRFGADSAYAARLRAHGESLAGVLHLDEFRETIGGIDPADEILLVDPTCYPVDGIPFRETLRRIRGRSPVARHLLAFDGRSSATVERLHGGDAGRVRRVQRYFQPATWPSPTGIVASLVRVGWMQAASSGPPSALEELRLSLSARGAPSEDIRLDGRCVVLTDEAGALSLVERRVAQGEVEPTRRRSRLAGCRGESDGRSDISADARLIGPVIIGPGAHVGSRALIVGPSVVGAGARVGDGVVLAQCLVLPGAVIDAGAIIRHRIVAARGERVPAARYRRNVAEAARVSRAGGSPAAGARYQIVKGWVEPVIAIAGLVVLAPVLAIVAMLVRLDSPGPIFYAAIREGRGGRLFRCWKFRSMQVNAESLQRALGAQQQMDGPQFKMDRDPRVTRVGHWLRRLNLDELPQLWNVARGEMSLVGPRPSPFSENQVCVPWRHGRLSVRPGITGLWQVCRRDRELGDFHQWIRFDLLYVRHASLLVDVKILLATFRAALGKHPDPLSSILPNATSAGGSAERLPHRSPTERWRGREALRPAGVLSSVASSLRRGEGREERSVSPAS